MKLELQDGKGAQEAGIVKEDSVGSSKIFKLFFPFLKNMRKFEKFFSRRVNLKRTCSS